MLVIPMPKTFAEGQTAPCRINYEKRRVRHEGTHLVLLPADADQPEDRREVLMTYATDGGALIMYACEDKDGDE